MNIKYIQKTILFFLVSIFIFSGCRTSIKDYSETAKLPGIFPDYTGVVIPPNIAPLNFIINEQGTSYHIEIYSKNGDKIKLSQSSPKVEIPIRRWHKLLSSNKGNNLYIDIYSKQNKWIKYKTISDSIVSEPIDNHLVYRLINAVYIFWRQMGIYQRNLENFDESAIYENSSANYGCVNCHSFSKNNPQKMSLHFRSEFPGTMILNGKELKKISTKTKYTMSACVYPSWHPSGDYVAYSVNLINQNFTADKTKLDEVSDKASDIVVYNVKTNTITTSPKVSTKSRENLPTWSPDGKWLYFISAPEMTEKPNSRVYTKYSLLRIPFDPTTNIWGNVDTVLSANKTGKSISFARISPDGHYIVFCMSDFGYFTIYDVKSDLYIMDLTSRQYKKMDISGPYNESYHSWSSNGRWMVFSSKCLDNVYSRPFFTYFDSNGNAHKPFVMPQRDPLYYNTFIKNYNIPEMVTGKVELNTRKTRDLVHRDPIPVQFDASVDVDALSGATKIKK